VHRCCVHKHFFFFLGLMAKVPEKFLPCISSRDCIRFAQWNVRSAVKQRRGEIEAFLNRHKIDVCCVQETRFKESLLHLKDFIFMNLSSDKIVHGGVGILIRKPLFDEKSSNFITCKESKGRILGFTCKHFSVISAYGPHEDYDSAEKNSFYSNLSAFVKIFPKKIPIFIGGDFNARVGEFGNIKRTIGKYFYKDQRYQGKENGELITNFAILNKMFLPKTFFAMKNHKSNATWKSGGKTSKEMLKNGKLQNQFVFAQLDHVLISKRFRKSILRCKHIGDFSYFSGVSDHKIVICDIKIKKPWFIQNTKKVRKFQFLWNIEKIEKFASLFRVALKQGLYDNSKFDGNAFWKFLSDEYLSTFSKFINLQCPDESACDIDFDEKRENSGFSCESFYAKKAVEIESAMKKHNSRKAWKLMKLDYEVNVSNSSKFSTEQIAEKLRVPKIDYDFDWNNYVAASKLTDNADDADNALPTFEEFSLAVKKISLNKAVSFDNIPTDIFKDEEIGKYLYEFLCVVWKTKCIPEEWKKSKLIPIPKKKLGEFRGINILSAGYKIYASIINNRIYKKVENFIGVEQCGFVKGKSTTDVIFAVRKLFESSKYAGINMHAMLIDFSKAFPSVSRGALKYILLKKVGIDKNMVDRIINLFDNNSEVIKVRNNAIYLKVENGVRQGCPLGPTLFLVVLAELLQEIETKDVFKFAYCDDLTIMSHSKDNLDKVLVEIIHKGKKYGLLVNQDKTEFINLLDRKYEKPIKLLGTWIGENDFIVENNIKKATQSFYAFYDSIWRQNISIHIKMEIFNSFCLNILLYGLDTLAISTQLEEKLNSFCYKCYKIMLGIYYSDSNKVISKEKVYVLIKKTYKKFNLASDTLRYRRLQTWFHMKRNHINDHRNIFNYSPPGKSKFCNLLTLVKVIERDLVAYKDFYIPREV
jgi:exonuclease III